MEEENKYKSFVGKRLYLSWKKGPGKVFYYKGELKDVTKDHFIFEDKIEGTLLIPINEVGKVSPLKEDNERRDFI